MNTLEKPPRRQEGKTAATDHPRLHPPERTIAVWGPLVAVIVIAILIVFGVWRHVQQVHEEQAFAEETSQTIVNYVSVERNQKPVDLVIPGSVLANHSTTLYARTNGYVGKWLVDIGDNVTAGQLLAVIETPDVDEQLKTALGNLDQAKANFEIARVTAQRWRDLLEQKVVSMQDNDEKQSSYEAAGAAQAAAQATVNQLQQEVSFNQIVAPFDGRITNRLMDIGTLVSAGSGSAGTPLYNLAQTDPLLIYVYVPQSDAPLVHDGITAKLLVREFPGEDFRATVDRTAGAIDPVSRTMLTELEIPNPDNKLYAGIYAEVEFSLVDADAPIMVPSNAFLFRSQGPQVALLQGDKIHWQTIQIGRDYGTEMECISGLRAGDHIVVNPSDDLQEGMQVKAQPQQTPAPASGAAPSPAGNAQK